MDKITSIGVVLFLLASIGALIFYIIGVNDSEEAKKYINRVKKAHYWNYTNCNYDEALDAYCKDGKWEYFVADKKKKIVEYDAKAVVDNKMSDIRVQFVCDKNNVEYAYFDADKKHNDWNSKDDFINYIFSNYMPEGGNRDISTYMGTDFNTVKSKYSFDVDPTSDKIDEEICRSASNRCWSVMDADIDDKIDMVSITDQTDYNILGMKYGQEYDADKIQNSILKDYQYTEQLYEGNGMAVAQNDKYCIRMMIKDMKVSQILMVDLAVEDKLSDEDDTDTDDEEYNSMDDLDDDTSDSSNSTTDNNYTDDDSDYDSSEDDYSDNDSDSGDYDDDSDYDDDEDADSEDEDVYTDYAFVDYVIDDSDSRYLDDDDLSSLSKDELKLARNEIFARYGYIFKSKELKDYFSGKDWYEPSIKPSKWKDSMLNKYEKKNVKLIKKYEAME